MPSPVRFLQTSAPFTAAEPPASLDVDSDVVVILAALLCALICVVGLALVARCAWLRRYVPSGLPPPPAAPPSKGLKKKALRSLPKEAFVGPATAAAGGRLAECAICLAEFADGDEIRILPQCVHRFHVGCVDTWLAIHSSCPSCRRVLVVPPASRCRTCGASSGEGSAAVPEGGVKPREDGGEGRFLP